MGVKLEHLTIGDIILDMDDGQTASHSMLWVGRDKAIAHAADKPSLVLLNYVSDVFGAAEKPLQYTVYRHPDTKVASYAAKFAKLWAVPGRDERPPCGEVTTYGKSRYAIARRLRGMEPFDDWDVMSLFHAVRAYAKARLEKPLSKKGVSCSQFVTYCYQCASIEAILGNNIIDPKVLQGLMVHDTAIALTNEANAHRIKLTAILDFHEHNTMAKVDPGTANELLETIGPDAKNTTAYGRAIGLTEGLMFDAKYTSVGYLHSRLEDSKSSFKKLGYALPLWPPSRGKADDLFLLPLNQFADAMKGKKLRELFVDKLVEAPIG